MGCMMVSEAERLLRATLDARASKLGPAHPDTVATQVAARRRRTVASYRTVGWTHITTVLCDTVARPLR